MAIQASYTSESAITIRLLKRASAATAVLKGSIAEKSLGLCATAGVRPGGGQSGDRQDKKT